ncbi:transposase [Candidatus Kaiserbacteria bacterium]|nr:transposase [Candidatus Kaiserbacteria bacterium]
MRVEKHGVDSVLHVIKRGARGAEIVLDENDRERFLKSLYFLNDEYSDDHWLRDTQTLSLERPGHWPDRRPLVSILAWTLMPNHFHLLLREIHEGGIATFMQRLGGSMTLCFNAKYSEQGSIFQGGYKGKLVEQDTYLRHLVFYILVKNVLELYPGGLKAALKDFDRAWEWALSYKYSSLRVCALGEHSLIVDEEALNDLGLLNVSNGASRTYATIAFKREAKEALLHFIQAHDDIFSSLLLEQW